MIFSPRFHRLSLLTATLLLTAGAALAQDPGSGGPTPGGTQDPTAVPLDGGASLLLAAGVGIGLRQLRRSRLTKH